MEKVSIIGLDLAKRSFQAHGARADGGVGFRKKLSRETVLAFLAEQSRCVVVMEACGSAHYWGRAIGDLGHEVRLIPPAYVKPFVKRQKNDAADAEAICEAPSRSDFSFSRRHLSWQFSIRRNASVVPRPRKRVARRDGCFMRRIATPGRYWDLRL